jgi:hypothetical protein
MGHCQWFESDLADTAGDVMRLVSDIDHKSAKALLDGFLEILATNGDLGLNMIK